MFSQELFAAINAANEAPSFFRRFFPELQLPYGDLNLKRTEHQLMFDVLFEFFAQYEMEEGKCYQYLICFQFLISYLSFTALEKLKALRLRSGYNAPHSEWTRRQLVSDVFCESNSDFAEFCETAGIFCLPTRAVDGRSVAFADTAEKLIRKQM